VSLDARLTRVMPGLSARERFLAELRAFKSGERPDLQLRRTLPPSQAVEFEDYLRLKRGVNIVLAVRIAELALLVDNLQARCAWMQSIGDLALLLWELAPLVAAKRRPAFEKVIARSSRPVDLPWDEIEKEGSWLDLAEGILRDLQANLKERWLEVLAAERVLDEAAQEVGGEDVGHPRLRAFLERSTAKLTSLASSLGVALAPLEPDALALEEIRDLLETARTSPG